MSRRVRCLCLVPLLLLAVGCAGTLERIDEARSSVQGSAEELSGTVRFCLGVARTLSSYEAGAPAPTVDAIEELIVHAPPEVQADAEAAVAALRTAQEGSGDVLADPELRAALERLRATTADVCDPTS
jgi:hypothetical protein